MADHDNEGSGSERRLALGSRSDHALADDRRTGVLFPKLNRAGPPSEVPMLTLAYRLRSVRIIEQSWIPGINSNGSA